MIKRLRRRLIVIMMTLITVVLAVTFASQIIASANDMKNSSIRSLTQGLPRTESISAQVPPEQRESLITSALTNRSPSSTVYIVYSDEEEVVEIWGSFDELSDGTMEEILTGVIKQNKAEGVLNTLDLRYKIFETDDQHIIIGLIDISYENSFIQQQIINYSVIGLISLCAFFIISLFLSKIAVRPVAAAWQQQQQFVADASHELKTPITIMLTNTSILLSEKNGIPAKAKKWIVYIEQEAKQMRRLVEDLLFLARLDTADKQYIFTPIDLSDAVFQCTLPFEPVFFESGRVLESDITPKLTILGDAVKIKQLVSILLDNAHKFSLPDATVSVRLHKEGEKAVLSVSNPSEPIDRESLSKIFDRFYRLDSARTRGSNSYGLGLAIAKEIVEMLDGKITVKSGADNRLTFTVVFPLISAAKAKKSNA